ncbi:MAG: M56 family metallopeptidase [Anaerolineae bacterium]
MIEIHWRGGRPGADGPFYALVILALGLLAGLAGFIVRYAPAVVERATDACMTVAESAASAGSALLVPWSVTSIIVGFAVVTIIWQLAATRILMRRLLQHALPMPASLAAAADLAGLAEVDYVADERAFAFCYGVTRPRVCVSSALVEMLTPIEMEAVLLHERHHLVSRDPLKVLLSRALGTGLFFLPAARDLRDRYMVGKEIAADASAAQAVQSELPLASALLKLLSQGDQGLPSTVAAIGAFNVTEERIQRILKGGAVGRASLERRRLLASTLVVVAIFAASYLPLAVSNANAMPGECSQISLASDLSGNTR